MKKNAKSKNTDNNTPVGGGIKHEHPGRPRYEMVFPTTLAFTFSELMRANGVDTRKFLGNGRENGNYGKGDNATMLTIRKNIKYALATEVKLKSGEIVKKAADVFLMKGYTAVPDSDDGLGRRGLLYRHADTAFSMALVEAKVRGAEGLTDKVQVPKVTRKPRKVNDTAAVDQTIADAQAILAEPASTVVIAPVVPASVIPDAVHNPIVAPVAEMAPVTPVAHVEAAPEVSVPIAETPAPVAPVAAPVVPVETAPVTV